MAVQLKEMRLDSAADAAVDCVTLAKEKYLENTDQKNRKFATCNRTDEDDAPPAGRSRASAAA